jgi:hypothetical protein
MAKLGCNHLGYCRCICHGTPQNWLEGYPELYEAVQAGNDVFNP